MNLFAVLLMALVPVTGAVEDVSHSVAVVETFDSRGTGFLVDDTTVMTAAHVAPEGTVTVRFGDTEFSGSVVRADSVEDLALIELDGHPDVEPLQIASTTPEIGEEVLAIGAPTDEGLTVTRGIVSAVFDDGEIQTDASVNPGNSGGPLVRPDGEVLGVVVMKADGAEGIGYAVGADKLRALMGAPIGGDERADDPDAARGAIPPDAAPLPDSGEAPQPSIPRTSPPEATDSGSLLVPLGIAGGVVVFATGALALLVRSRNNTDDFEVRLGPVHDRFGG